MLQLPGLDEVGHLYDSLDRDQRDELLQCLLITATRGGDAVVQLVQDCLLARAGEALLEELDTGHL